MPKVSVIMPLYNHALFVAEAIGSVLNQSEHDLELIVVDDFSTDNSVALVEGIDDPRLRLFRNGRNKGACWTMNLALREVRSEYIAVCNSDDVWERDKIQLQLEMMRNMPEVVAVFSDVNWIDDTGRRLSGGALPYFADVFRQPNRSRFAWTRHLVEGGNCLCHPSVLIRRNVFERVGMYDNRYRQLPDYDMWLRVLTIGEIYVSSEKLLRFRVHAGNTSRQDEANRIRTLREHVWIARSFFANLSYENFVHSFGVKSIDALKIDSDRAVQISEMVEYLTTTECPLGHVLYEAGLELAFQRFGIVPDAEVDFADDLRLQGLSASSRGVLGAYGVAGGRKSLVKQGAFAVFGTRIYSFLRDLNRRRRRRRKSRMRD